MCSSGTPFWRARDALALLKTWKVSSRFKLSLEDAFLRCSLAAESERGTSFPDLGIKHNYNYYLSEAEHKALKCPPPTKKEKIMVKSFRCFIAFDYKKFRTATSGISDPTYHLSSVIKRGCCMWQQIRKS